MKQHVYIAIDLKSFYASVECVDRGLDPLKANLVVADQSRTEKTICLAVSPSLKRYHIPGRARLFEVVQRVREVNADRKRNAPNHKFIYKTWDSATLEKHPEYEIDYIVAPPRMARYIEVSSTIYDIYLNYIAPEDIHVYSIDEVFMDVTPYLHMTHMTPRELAVTMIQEVFEKTKITATAGIGTNLYLSKVAMDIVAKHIPEDENGVRIAELTERSYRELLWDHQPITDFWRVGKGYAKKLWSENLFTMGDIARCSIGKDTEYYNEDLLYNLFGVNAELLIDHAWGWEPCEMAEIKAYKPSSNSISSGQVLCEAYSVLDARIVVQEMVEQLALDLVSKHLATKQIVLTIGYDRTSLDERVNPSAKKYHGEIKKDYYGRLVPKHAHGTANMTTQNSSTKLMMDAVLSLYDEIVDPDLLVRRITIAADQVVDEETAREESRFEQLCFFEDFDLKFQQKKEEQEALEKEKKLQHAMLELKGRYGKNAILKGTNLQEVATAMSRNEQIGGHKA